MTLNGSSIIHRAQYLALRLGAMFLNIFDIEDNLAGARGVGSLLYRLDRRHRRRAVQNLRRSFPQLSDAEVFGIAENSMRHFLQLGVEVMFSRRLIHLDTWADHVRLRHLAEPLELMLSDRPTIMVTGHFGNWELLGYVLATVGLDIDAIARPIDNPYLDRWLLGVRQRQGVRIHTKFGATDRMTDILQRGGTLGFIGDQNAGDKGLFVPYFGRLASAYKSIGLLAIQYNASVVCGYARRVPASSRRKFAYEIGATDVIHPRDWADQPDPLYYLTARYARGIETMVRMSPEQYLWIHRRWKSRPRHERLGRPMPESLRRKIEQLPWMTPAQLAELEKPVHNPDPA
jgi:Kdo2-lipid IVA lauroyltransferase/acyltransferase